MARTSYSQGVRSRFLAACLGLLALAPLAAAAAEPIRLTRITHIYGIVPDPTDPAKVLLATDRGFFVAGPDGNAEQLSAEGTPFMAFAAAPNGTFLVTGGERQGAVASRDGGKTWAPVAAGPAGPGPFLVLEASRTDPQLLFGAAVGVLYRSNDGGRTWTELGPAPAPVVDLAAAAAKDVAYLGTARRLFRTADAGKTRAPVAIEGANRAASMAATLPDGATYAFVTGIGLVQMATNGASWTVVTPAADFDGALLHLTARANTGRTYAVTQYMKILVSDDGGKTWAPFDR